MLFQQQISGSRKPAVKAAACPVPPAGVYAGAGTITLGNLVVDSNTSNGYPIVTWDTRNNAITKHLVNIDVPVGYSLLSGGNSPAVSQPTVYLNSVYRGMTRRDIYTSPNYAQLDDSTNSSTHGTSQYVPGTFPVPTCNLREVGPGKEFATPLDAYNAAANGDNIVIQPGTYDCSGFRSSWSSAGGTYITKNVRFYGATENPSDVILDSNIGAEINFVFRPYQTGALPEETGMGMFHMTLQRNGYAWRHVVTIYDT